MECTVHQAADPLPPQFAEVTTAQVTFYTFVSVLDQLEQQEAVQKTTLIATSQGYLVELAGDRVVRTKKLPTPNVNKLVVHHTYEPPQVYVVLLCQPHTASFLLYHDLQLLQERHNITDVTSADPQATGCPHLILTHLTGEVEEVSSTVLLSLHDDHSTKEQDKEEGKGRSDAVEALGRRLKSGMRQVEKLQSQRMMKEQFIADTLLNLQSYLHGSPASQQARLVPALTWDGSSSSSKGEVSRQGVEEGRRMEEGALEVVNVRHKLLHHKWVVGVNVINNSTRLLVCEPRVVVQAVGGQERLTFTSTVLKTVLRRQGETGAGPAAQAGTRVTIEPLHPAVLRPTKRACILAVCDIPTFAEGPKVTCTGLICYTCKSLKTEATQAFAGEEEAPTRQLQVCFQPVELMAHDLHTHTLVVEQLTGIAGGVSFSSVALIAASQSHPVSLTSLVSPLNNFLTLVAKKYKLVKVEGVSELYCLHLHDAHPLAMAAFTLTHLSAHLLTLTLYTRDERQAVVMVHSLLSALPSDTSVQPPSPGPDTLQAKATQDLRHQLLTRMHEAADYVITGLQDKLQDGRQVREKEDAEPDDKGKENGTMTKYQELERHRRGYERGRERLAAHKGHVTFEPDNYRDWRHKLYHIHTDIDQLYVKYLEQCTA